jgi:WD and tetratricopeptide repeat-containing protein 1
MLQSFLFFIFRQFDLRSQHTCNSGTSACILVNLLNHLGQGAEAKCLAVSPTRPELLAIGANDPYVRLYDRRMIKTTTVQVNLLHNSKELIFKNK